MKKMKEFIYKVIENRKLGKKSASWKFFYMFVRTKFNIFKKRFLQSVKIYKASISDFKTYVIKKKN